MKRMVPGRSGTGLKVVWTKVTTPDGRARMEMRWTAPPAVPPRTS